MQALTGVIMLCYIASHDKKADRQQQAIRALRNIMTIYFSNIKLPYCMQVYERAQLMCGPGKLKIRYVVMYIIVIFLLDKHKMIFTQQWEKSAT